MSLYIRGYADFSYEIIYLEGMFRKSRTHILINPSKDAKLPGMAGKDEVEINIESLTHIVSMETSVDNSAMIERTVFLAERTNKPIITNQESSTIFKDRGLSVKQLRILGFQEEVVDGIQIDPVYLDELSDDVKPISTDSGISSLLKKVNPLNWKPFRQITGAILPGMHEEEKMEQIDDSKPLGFIITLGAKLRILIPLDKRGVRNLNRILPNHEINILVVPNQNISFIKKIVGDLSKMLLLSQDLPDDETIIVPKSHNTGIQFDTTIGGIEQWIEIK